MSRLSPWRLSVVSLVVLVVFGAGVASGILLGSREAHAQLSSTSTIYVPPDGINFRTRSGRTIARLSYGVQGGVFELLDEHEVAQTRFGRVSPVVNSQPASPPSLPPLLPEPLSQSFQALDHVDLGF